MTTQPDTRAALLKGAPERRGISEFEVRDAGNGLLHFTGYAAVFDDPYEITDRFGTFTETIERKALSRTLSRNPDVVLNVNHDGLPLARTISGTLKLGTDTRGYHVEADLDPRDPDVESVRYKLERGDLSDMSWAFKVLVDVWNDDETERSVREVSVDGGDVSIVTTGANRNTNASLRGALDALANLDVLTECRTAGFDIEAVRAAYATLGTVLVDLTPRTTMSIRAAERALELD